MQSKSSGAVVTSEVPFQTIYLTLQRCGGSGGGADREELVAFVRLCGEAGESLFFPSLLPCLKQTKEAQNNKLLAGEK